MTLSHILSHFTRWTAIVISICIADSVAFAYDNSLMGSLGVMPAYRKYFKLSTALVSTNIAMGLVGGIVISIVAGPLVDYRGRRFGILLACICQIIGAILQGGARHIAMFIVGRFFIGGGTGLAQVACTSYVAEAVPPQVRAFSCGLFLTCWGVGALIAAGVCYGTASLVESTWSWRIPSLLQIVPALIVLVILVFLPESPRWLVHRNRTDEATTVLAKIYGREEKDPAVQTQLQGIIDATRRDKEESKDKLKGYLELFRTRTHRKRTLLALTTCLCAMLTGSNIITFYFGIMFDKAGIHDHRTQLEINVCLTSWQLVVAFAGSMSAEKLGRRTLCLTSLGLATIFLFLVGGLTAKYGGGTNKSGIYATIGSIFLFLGGYAFGMTPLPPIYAPEVLPYSLRGYGMSLVAAFGRGCGLLAVFALPYGFEAIGWKMYMVNACFNFLLWVVVAVFWVETKGCSLEQIDALFERGSRVSVAESDPETPNKSGTTITVDERLG